MASKIDSLPAALLDRLAARAVAAAKEIVAAKGPGAYYESAFIAAVYAVDACALSYGDFQAMLVRANREGLLRLRRADLVAAMDPNMVRNSSVAHMNATFHMIAL